MSAHKRKRAPSHTSHASSQPSDTDADTDPILNPHAHSESTIKQLLTAGLTEADLLPCIPQFPHRPISQHHLPHSPSPSPSSSDNENASPPPSEDDTPIPTSKKATLARRAKAARTAQTTALALLTATLHHALATNNLARAARAFALIRRSAPRGKPVDLRRDGLWALGVEVLMRAGTTTTSTTRWGAAANMPAVREYLEALVRLYPYNRLHPKAVSGLDFYPVLFACEVYDSWVEQRRALEKLERDEAEDEEEGEGDDAGIMMMKEEEDGHENYLSGRERRVRWAKAEVALGAMRAMREVAARMDALMAEAPYSRSAEMWRLRGMVALYVGDLSVPPPPRTDDEEAEGVRTRDAERAQARRHFRRMRRHGGRVDSFTEKWLEEAGDGDDDGSEADGEDNDEDMGSALPVFSSLPMQ